MKKKSFLKTGMILAMCAALLATGCGQTAQQPGNNQTAAQDNKDTGKTETPAKELIPEIKIMSPFLEPTAPEEGNLIDAKLEEMTGKKVTVSWVPNSNYEDRMNIVLASGDLPHIMVVTQKSGGFVTSANAGAFWDLTDYLADYPNLAKADAATTQNASLNGKVFGIYRKRDLIRSCVVLRKDWLTKLGLEEPKTAEDLYNIAKAFTEKDPDGNGKNDTTGIIIPQWPASINTNSPLDVIVNWYGAANAWGKDKDGNLAPSFMQEEYMQGLEFIKKMYDEKLINADFATLSSNNWNDEFLNGHGGIIIDTYSRGLQLQRKLKEAYPDTFGDMITMTGNLASENGSFALPTAGYAGFLVIPKTSVKTEEELREVLSFIDKTNEKDVQVVMNNGLEGVNFEVSEGFSQSINSDSAETKALISLVRCYAQIGTNVGGNQYYVDKPATDVEKANYEKQKQQMAADAGKAVHNPTASFISETYTKNGVQLDNIIQDARIQFIAGQIDKTGFEQAVELWKTSGGNKVIEEMNTLYKATGEK